MVNSRRRFVNLNGMTGTVNLKNVNLNACVNLNGVNLNSLRVNWLTGVKVNALTLQIHRKLTTQNFWACAPQIFRAPEKMTQRKVGRKCERARSGGFARARK